eukprot:2979211-Alexandrium_andersonii.AAC.1
MLLISCAHRLGKACFGESPAWYGSSAGACGRAARARAVAIAKAAQQGFLQLVLRVAAIALIYTYL